MGKMRNATKIQLIREVGMGKFNNGEMNNSLPEESIIVPTDHSKGLNTSIAEDKELIMKGYEVD
eukprot:CAMPEP_0170547554 /NCGR_PEP_ID=MMETSP0211-20121228/5967_1 /TAXON_ID=311385 /ORGANISM="Pseudokeronopsis sp., Strain OXSARD2" /LENGTH=63 /DNA_ID=CAMNT_0010852683 /DNA_START=889 /DNA_END=1080 /DNA_ORIENTATION=-